MGPFQIKNFSAEVKDIDTRKGIIEGYFNTWGIVDADGDELIPGAFTKSINENGPGASRPRLMHLWMHKADKPLHRFTEPGSIMEDQKGLFFRSQISKTSWGRDVLQLYNDQVVNEHSIGFQTIKEQKADGHNKILEVKLWEGSTVTWGSNEDTPVTGMKSEDHVKQAEKFTERIDRITKALKDGTYTDDTFILLEIQLKQIQAAYESLIKQIQPDNTGDGDEPTDRVSLDTVFNNLKI